MDSKEYVSSHDFGYGREPELDKLIKLELRNIDDVKFYEEVKDEIYKDLGQDVEIYEEESDELSKLFSDLFSGMKSLINSKEKSETEKVLEMIEKDGSGVPMYYAMP